MGYPAAFFGCAVEAMAGLEARRSALQAKHLTFAKSGRFCTCFVVAPVDYWLGFLRG
jgi:hypothetical protein